MNIFADAASLDDIAELSTHPRVSGFTTNPTLMRAAGVSSYKEFATECLRLVPRHPVSFEVLADDLEGMYLEALTLASWASNVYVKIPIMNTKQEPTLELIRNLSEQGVKVNVTAVMTGYQIQNAAKALDTETPSILSIFAGRISDTGRDPRDLIRKAVIYSGMNTEILWASSRELLNIAQAERSGCHIITLTPALIRKLDLWGRDLYGYSLDTVRMFYEDAQQCHYKIV